MTTETENNVTKIVVGGVVSFVGICFVTVSIWLASTVNSLSKSSSSLEITIITLSRQTEKLADKVDKIAEEQAKRTVNVYRVKHLEDEIRALKLRIKELESK